MDPFIRTLINEPSFSLFSWVVISTPFNGSLEILYSKSVISFVVPSGPLFFLAKREETVYVSLLNWFQMFPNPFSNWLCIYFCSRSLKCWTISPSLVAFLAFTSMPVTSVIPRTMVLWLNSCGLSSWLMPTHGEQLYGLCLLEFIHYYHAFLVADLWNWIKVFIRPYHYYLPPVKHLYTSTCDRVQDKS